MTILLKPLQGGRPFVLDKPILLIGRHPDCDIILKNSGKISRKHCCVALVDNRFVVRDLDSMNGVWVNGKRVEHTARLRTGDELMIGDIPFALTRTEEEVTRQPADATVPEIEPNDMERNDARDEDPRGIQAAAALRKRRDPKDAGPSDGVEFSSAFAVPVQDDDDDDFVIPLADLDE